MMLRTLTLKSLATAVVLAVTVGGNAFAATILLDDTWADGSRLETNLPTESRTNVSDTASVAVAAGTLSQTMATSSRRVHTYFTPNGAPATLNVGDKLLATIEFVPAVTLDPTTSRNFRVGLFHDPTTAQAASDGIGDGGPSNGWADSQGYAIFMSMNGQNANSQFQLNKRTVIDGSQTSLMGAAAAYTTATSGGMPVNGVVDTPYTLTFQVHKVSASVTDLTATLSNASGVLSTHTSSDNGTTYGAAVPYDKFDQLMFRFSNDDGVGGRVDFKRLKVELIQIPEPASLALVGLAGVLVVGSLRSRK